MSPDLHTVLQALPNLAPAELQQIRGKTSALLSLNGGVQSSPAPTPSGVDYLLDGVIYELRRRGLLSRNSGLLKRLITPAYERASSEVRIHLDECVGALKAVEVASLGQLAARALATYLERGHVPISPSTMLNNISKVPVALDASYPGYLEAGLLSFCWRK